MLRVSGTLQITTWTLPTTISLLDRQRLLRSRVHPRSYPYLRPLRSIVSTPPPSSQPIFESKHNPTLNPLLLVPSSSFIFLRDLPLYLLDSLPFIHVIRFKPPTTHSFCVISIPHLLTLVCMYVLANCTQLSSYDPYIYHDHDHDQRVHCPPTPRSQVVVVKTIYAQGSSETR